MFLHVKGEVMTLEILYPTCYPSSSVQKKKILRIHILEIIASFSKDSGTFKTLRLLRYAMLLMLQDLQVNNYAEYLNETTGDLLAPILLLLYIFLLKKGWHIR